jgi:flagellar basal body-associated protein FliL
MQAGVYGRLLETKAKNTPACGHLNMFRALVILLICLLTATAPAHAGGGGGEAKKKADSHSGGAKQQRAITTLESWVAVYPISVSVVQEDEVRGQLQVWFGMDVPDAVLRTRAEAIMPRLRDAWLSRLSQYAATSARARKPANIADVSLLLQATADQMLQNPGSKVLMGSVIITMR